MTQYAATALTRKRSRDGAGGSSTQPQCPNHKGRGTRRSLIKDNRFNNQRAYPLK